MLSYYNVHVTKPESRQEFSLPRAPLGRIVNALCFSPDQVSSIGCMSFDSSNRDK